MADSRSGNVLNPNLASFALGQSATARLSPKFPQLFTGWAQIRAEAAAWRRNLGRDTLS